MIKIKLNLEEMADSCGVRFVRCDSKEWGGTWAFQQILPSGSIYSVNGFKTKRKAVKKWFTEEFDSKLGRYLFDKYFTV